MVTGELYSSFLVLTAKTYFVHLNLLKLFPNYCPSLFSRTRYSHRRRATLRGNG